MSDFLSLYNAMRINGVAQDNRLQTRESELREKRMDLRDEGKMALSLQQFIKQNPPEAPASRLGTVIKDTAVGTAVGTAAGLALGAFMNATEPSATIGTGANAVALAPRDNILPMTIMGGASIGSLGLAVGLAEDLNNPVHKKQLDKYEAYLNAVEQAGPAPTPVVTAARAQATQQGFAR